MGRPHEEKEVVMRKPTQGPFAHSRNRWWLFQEGRVTFSQIICITILFLVGMQSLKCIAAWYNNWRLEEAMQDAVNDASFSTDPALIASVLAKAQQLQVPLDPQNLYVERSSQGGIRLWATYQVTLTFPLGFSHTQRFRPEVRSGRR
jgi:hypothetical protein